MKKTILTTLSLLFIIGSLFSQELRHSKGNKALDFTVHKVKPGLAYSFGYTHFLKDNLLFKAKVNYENGSIDDLSTTIWQCMPTAAYSLAVLPPVLYVSAEAGAVIGTEKYSNENFLKKENNIIYGGVYGIETEIYINNNIAFLINTQQIYAFGTTLSPHRWQIGGGIRLVIQ